MYYCFQSREIAHITGCSGKAFDLSSYAIESAKYNVTNYYPHINIEYTVSDGYDFKSSEKFSHILVGGGLQFFSDPIKMKKRCLEFIGDEGYILASPFFIIKNIPESLIKEAYDVFGIQVTTKPYKEVMSLYNDLEIIYEDRNPLICETDEEIHSYCIATAQRACDMYKINDNEVFNSIYDRLNKVRSMSNKLREFQEYAVLVLRYREKVYPNRYVELF